VTAVGCLAGLDHCSDQDIPAIGNQHPHNAAQALFAAPRTYPASPCLSHTFARINTDGNHFCLCRAETTGASEVLVTTAVPPGLIARVQ
jgi:hypothetical protein